MISYILIGLMAFYQIISNYISTYLNEFIVFTVISSFSLLFFIAFKGIRHKIESPFYFVPIVLIGQVLAPFFYFKGIQFTDLLTQIFIYSLYPIIILIYDDHKELRLNINKIFKYFITFLLYSYIFIFELNLDNSLYLWLSLICLLIHKIIHKNHVITNNKITGDSLTFYGLISSSLFGLYLVFINGYSKDLFGIFNMLNLNNYFPMILLSFIILNSLILTISSVIRNKLLVENSFEKVFLGILLLPAIAITLNNFMFFIDNKIEIDLRLISIIGLIYIFILLIFKINKKLLSFIILMNILFITFIQNYFIHDINLFTLKNFKLIELNDDTFRALVKKKDDSFVLYKNKKDFDLLSFEEVPVNLNYTLKLENEKEVIEAYIYGTLNQSNVSLGYINGERFVIKEIEPTLYNRMIDFKQTTENKSYLSPINIYHNNGKLFITQKLLNGITFEDYYQMKDNSEKNIFDLISSIIEIIDINIDLEQSGFINRDTHNRNILFTSDGIKIIDYDFIFNINDSGTIIDKYGFNNNLYDFYKLLFIKDNKKYKFNYLENDKFKSLPNSFDSLIFNKNLEIINKRLHSNYYFYNEKCDVNNIEALFSLKNDMESLQKNKLIINNKKINIYNLSQYSNCLNNKIIYSKTNGISFIVYQIPEELSIYNYIEVHNYNKDDLNFEINKELIKSLQLNTNHYKFTKSVDLETKEDIIKFIMLRNK